MRHSKSIEVTAVKTRSGERPRFRAVCACGWRSRQYASMMTAHEHYGRHLHEVHEPGDCLAGDPLVEGQLCPACEYEAALREADYLDSLRD
jgi:hypothetical protein